MKVIEKSSQALALGRLTTAPSNPVDGTVYYNTTDSVFYFREAGTWVAKVNTDELANYYTKTEIDAIINGLTTDDIEEGSTNLYFTSTRAQNSAVVNSTAGNETNQAPSVAAMKSYVQAEIADVDLTNYYTKTETDTLLDAKADQTALDQEIQDRQDADALLIPLSQKGANNGVATLDAGGKVPVSQLPAAIMTYEGLWDPASNVPTLADGVGDAGMMYRVSVDAGGGIPGLNDPSMTDFHAGDYVIYSGTVWQKADGTDAVISVNGQQGVVSLDTDDIAEGTTNLYFTTTRARTAAVVDSTAGTQTDQAASVSSMKTYVNSQGFLKNVVEDTTPELGGDLDVLSRAIQSSTSQVVLAGQNSVRRAKAASKTNFVEEEYIHSIALAGSSTDVQIASLSFAYATYDAVEICYKVKNIDGKIRLGLMRVFTDGTNAYVTDNFGDSAQLHIEFDAVVSGANMIVTFTNTSVDATMRADVKKFLV